MKKVLLLLSLALCTSLLGCGAQQSTSSDNQTTAAPKQITVNNSASSSGGSTNSNLDKEAFKNGYTPFSLKDSAMYTSLFQA